MSISHNEFEKIKKLSKLEFSDVELENVIKRLNSVISVISKVKDIDCSNISPLSSVSDQYQMMREDNARIIDSSDEILKNAPETTKSGDESFFVIPKSVKD